MKPRTRFAPSPTGDLHVGGAWTALASWTVARRAGGTVLLRIEDIDRPRVVAGSRERIEEDLAWLGLDWDERPWVQSDRTARYEEVLARLQALGLVYPCDCSRAEISRIASAPHEGEELVYPGTCRDRDPARPMRRDPALRVRVPRGTIVHDDPAAGRLTQDLARDVGDFVLRRGDGVFAYQLAVVVDDLDSAITDVVRGADLLGSTPRQAWLARVLGASPPAYTHVPLVVAGDGSRLRKREPDAVIRSLRERGVPAARVVGELAHGLGLAPTSAPATPREVAAACADRPIAWRRDAFRIPDWLARGV